MQKKCDHRARRGCGSRDCSPARASKQNYACEVARSQIRPPRHLVYHFPLPLLSPPQPEGDAPLHEAPPCEWELLPPALGFLPPSCLSSAPLAQGSSTLSSPHLLSSLGGFHSPQRSSLVLDRVLDPLASSPWYCHLSERVHGFVAAPCGSLYRLLCWPP